MAIDLRIPEEQRCDQCPQEATIAHPLVCPIGEVQVGYLCQHCLDLMKRDAFEERYGDEGD
jgi:hypothetical protein